LIPVTTFSGKTVAVFGLGASGLATCRALAAGGARVIVDDDDQKKLAEAGAAGFARAGLRGADWSAVAALVLSPGVPLTHPAPHWAAALAQAAGVEVIGDIELFSRERKRHAPQAPFIAITGTNGKSTTTALIAHILRAAGADVQIGGNIGTPILALEPPASTRYHVIEVSSYQIDLAPSLAPSVGVLLNVTPDHLDRHGTMENYAGVKARLVLHADFAAVGFDDPYSVAIATGLRAPKVYFSAAENPGSGAIYVTRSTPTLIRRDGARDAVLADLTGIRTLRGQHNAQNAAAALAALLPYKLDARLIQEALRSFPGLSHRLEEVGRAGHVLFINDSKATNADSTEKALASFPGEIFWIAGGKAKAGGIASLGRYFPRIRRAYLIGEAAEDFAATLDGRVEHQVVGTLERAVEHAARDAAVSTAPEPVVLLSPACASFDQFRNFEVRGAAFRDLVRALDGIEPMKEAS
jgi:UDP-N-acetylmuramoylalanine--D-glutamate ligase